jgi:hypothetical protein
MEVIVQWTIELGELDRKVESMNGEQTEIDELLEELQGHLDARIYCDGGYPAEIMVLGEHIVAADIDHDGGPTLRVFSLTETLARFRSAQALVAADPELELHEVICETEVFTGCAE